MGRNAAIKADNSEVRLARTTVAEYRTQVGTRK